MKSKLIKILVASTLISTSNLKAEESYSFGVGIGVLYSGIGANISTRTANEMKYLSAGVLSYSTNHGATYGGGIGWIKTDVLHSDNNKHGLGVYLGAVGTEVTYRKRSALYGGALSYHYFFNGINTSGTTIGLSASYGKGKYDDGSGIMLELGYQF